MPLTALDALHNAPCHSIIGALLAICGSILCLAFKDQAAHAGLRFVGKTLS